MLMEIVTNKVCPNTNSQEFKLFFFATKNLNSLSTIHLIEFGNLGQVEHAANSHAIDCDAESDDLEEDPCHLQLFLDTQDHCTYYHLFVLLPRHPSNDLCPRGPHTEVGLYLHSLSHYPYELCWHSQVKIL